MFKVTSSEGQVHGLVDTREMAEAIVEMKKLGRDGRPPNKQGTNATKAMATTFKIEQVPDSAHPTFRK